MTNQDFINTIAPMIQKIAGQMGYSICSTIIAQAICESGWGKSSLAYKYNNYFGMKCGSSWKGKSVNLKTKEEYTVGTLTTIKDNFRVYDTLEQGIQGYFDFIQYPRYKNLKTAKTYREYAEMLKADGYATSSTYVNTLCKIVEDNDLTRFDVSRETSKRIQITITTFTDKPSDEEIALQVIRKMWGNGQERKDRLTQAGYDYKTIQGIVNKWLA